MMSLMLLDPFRIETAATALMSIFTRHSRAVLRITTNGMELAEHWVGGCRVLVGTPRLPALLGAGTPTLSDLPIPPRPAMYRSGPERCRTIPCARSFFGQI